MARYALLVGIDQYENNEIPPLHFAERDTEVLEQALVDCGGFQTHRLIGPQATRERILDVISGAAADIGWPAFTPKDQVLFFFSGHGQLVGGHYVLHAYRAQHGTGTHSVSVHDLAQILKERIPCEECVCIIDACRNLAAPGTRGGTVGFDMQSKRDIQKLGTAGNDAKLVEVLYGCDEGQISLEDGNLQQGVLTYHLAKVLREGGHTTIEDAADDAGDRMREWFQRHRPDCDQKPYLHRPPTQRRIVLFDRLSEVPPQISDEVAKVKQLVDAGEFDAAERLLETLTEQSPLSYPLKRLGRQISEARRKAEAATRVEQRRKVDEHVQALLEDAEKYRLDGELDFARQCAEEAVRIQAIGPAKALLERIEQQLRTGPTDRVPVLKRLFEQAEEHETSEPTLALSMYTQVLEVYPGNRRAIDGRDRCLLKLLAKQSHKQALSRLTEAQTPIDRLREELQEFRDLAMDAEADATQAELERCERAVAEAQAKFNFIERMASLALWPKTWFEFATSMKESDELAKEAFAIRKLELSENLLAELNAVHGNSLPDFGEALETLLGGARSDGTSAGETRDDNSLKMTLVWIPPGGFTMGSPKNEKGRVRGEIQVQVTLTQGFWLGQHAVTQLEWQQVMRTKPWNRKGDVKQGEDYPATYVNWNDAMSFCEKLTEKERLIGRIPDGWRYMLPTEAQWEYACRAGTKTAYSFGDDRSALADHAWFDDNADSHPQPVGQKNPNPWGLFDMHGNVAEWCLDWYSQKLAGETDPQGPSEGDVRVLRGGNWIGNAEDCRSAYRGSFAPRDRDSEVGFRVALVPWAEVRFWSDWWKAFWVLV